ncbi:VWA domain-containing protein [Thiomicrorhabdus sp. Milos-T2]|uniref:VWA domain-containing protein n=1 Tax=Thiomicrorhabdus sp. Milos-T2 TaxID=90814 RepID=UPI000494B85C|nr:VWA domain-containing protein [Thiomicrorhabdus sp. Milos-T2]
MEVLNSIHFLRPWCFLALLPIAWLIWRAWQANAKQGAWHKVIDPKFRTLLLGEDNSNEPSVNEKIGYLGITTAWILAVLALSGPWVKSIELPAQKAQQGVVIVLDLSLSMLADDLSPNRLSRVKYKLTDLLKQHPEFATGMVAYASSAHTISPISEDNRTLLNLLPSLNPVMMPNYGANPLLGFEKATKLFKGANITQGHILWITDDIEKQEVETVTDWFDSHAYSMTVMTVGTDRGGVVQIPNYGLLKDEDDKLIMPKLPLQRFQQLSQNSDIEWIPLIPGEGNVAELLPQKLAATDDSKSQEGNEGNDRQKDVKHPLDIGAYFLFLIIPLVALIFRRGTLLAFTLVVIAPTALLTPQPSYAKDWLTELPSLSSMFKSPDQQGYDAWKKKKYEAAGAHFENPQWRASALYRQGKYAEAAKMFNLDKSPTGHYNRGNALALSGSLQGAKEAYEKALQIKPDFKDAQANLAIINNLLAQKPPENKPKNQQNQDDKEQNSSSKNQKGHTQNQENNAGNQQEQSSNPSDSDASSDKNSDNTSSTNANDKSDNSGNAINESNGSGDSNDSSQPSPNTSKNPQSSSNSQEMGNQNSNNQTQGANDLDKPAIAEGDNSQDDKKPNPKDPASEMSPTKLDDGSSQSAQSKSSKTTGEGSKSNPRPKLSEEEQANQNWLKQIPDQPGLFLKRKFEYQFQQNPRKDQASDKQW